jgi:hypothetical protein
MELFNPVGRMHLQPAYHIGCSPAHCPQNHETHIKRCTAWICDHQRPPDSFKGQPHTAAADAYKQERGLHVFVP